MSDADLFRALGNERRLQILRWSRNPVAQFLPQRVGDLVEEGVFGQFSADKLGVNASTLSEHMRVLQASGLVTAKRIRQRTFHRRDDAKLASIASIVETI
ncbi:ArsR/SmtB family transcription factor [Sphingomonas melonis]